MFLVKNTKFGDVTNGLSFYLSFVDQKYGFTIHPLDDLRTQLLELNPAWVHVLASGRRLSPQALRKVTRRV